MSLLPQEAATLCSIVTTHGMGWMVVAVASSWWMPGVAAQGYAHSFFTPDSDDEKENDDADYDSTTVSEPSDNSIDSAGETKEEATVDYDDDDHENDVHSSSPVDGHEGGDLDTNDDESTASTASALENDIDIPEEEDVSGEETQERNIMGLQVWPDENSFLGAIEGGRLLLVVIAAPWCERGNNMKHMASSAATMLDETFASLSTDPTLPSLLKPLIGIMDASTAEEMVESFGQPVTHYPALKFVLTFPIGTQHDEEKNDHGGNDNGGNERVQLWDFLGPRETVKDLYDSVLMYWYRFVVSNTLNSQLDFYDGEDKPPIFTFPSQLQLTSFLEEHGERVLRPAQARKRYQSQLESDLYQFYMGHMEGNSGYVAGVFHPLEFLDRDDESCDEDEQFTQEIDPYIVIVQCRSGIVWDDDEALKVEDENTMDFKQALLFEVQRKAVREFDDLADEMSHRRDVAFFALNGTAYDEDTTHLGTKLCDGLFDGIDGNVNGAVAFFRARRYITYILGAPKESNVHEQNHNVWNHHRRRVVLNVKTDWDGIKQLPPHAVFVPSTMESEEQQGEIFGKGAVKDATTSMEYVQSKLVASTVVHATPSVIWFDRDRMAQLAFPWYRKIHAVLFVDMALVHKTWRPNPSHTPDRIWPSSLNHSSETAQLLVNQQRAIQMFYNAALRHRVERPEDDVVFLIVPSSEVRIMTTFGVDIWTPLDEAVFGMAYEDAQSNEDKDGGDEASSTNQNGYCSSSDDGESRNILPVTMITDSSGRSGMQSSRYYLCSKDIFASSRVEFSNGGAIGEFIDDFFTGAIGKPFIRSEAPLPTPGASSFQNINNSNVTVLTGNTFESLVMNRNDEHTMLLMQTTTCGHCKRFSIFWNELSKIIQAMNWSSVINVMKIDVSKNDVPHKKISAWDLPSVYYFPAGEKTDPIEMTPITKQNSNPQNDYDEGLSWVTSGYDLVKWMVNQGKLDLDHLMRLDGTLERDDSSMGENNEEEKDDLQ